MSDTAGVRGARQPIRSRMTYFMTLVARRIY